MRPAPASENFWSGSITKNGCTRRSATFRPPSSNTTAVRYEVASRLFELGALPPKPPGFTAVPARIAVLLRNWGLRPQTPAGALRKEGGFAASLLFRPLSRRSGCVPAEPYPPPRYFQRALYQLRRATNSAANGDYLTGCLTMKWLFRFHFARPFRLPLVGRGAGWTYRVLLIGT